MTANRLKALRKIAAYQTAIKFIAAIVEAGVDLSNIFVSNFESPEGMTKVDGKWVNRTVIIMPPGKEGDKSAWLTFNEFGKVSFGRAVDNCAGEAKIKPYQRTESDGRLLVKGPVPAYNLAENLGAYTSILARSGSLV